MGENTFPRRNEASGPSRPPDMPPCKGLKKLLVAVFRRFVGGMIPYHSYKIDIWLNYLCRGLI